MTKFKFGDMVTGSHVGYGVFMVVGPYLGDRGTNDEKGPAVWLADIATEYSDLNQAGTVWAIEKQLAKVKSK
jgi:hypothetical protein